MAKRISTSFITSDSSSEGRESRAKYSKLIQLLFLLVVSLILVSCGSLSMQPAATEATASPELSATAEVDENGVEAPDGADEVSHTQTPTPEPTATVPPTPTQTAMPEPALIIAGELNTQQQEIFAKLVELQYTRPTRVLPHTNTSVKIMLEDGSVSYDGQIYSGEQHVQFSTIPGHEGELIWASLEGVKNQLGIEADEIGVNPTSGQFTAYYEGKLVAQVNQETGRWEEVVESAPKSAQELAEMMAGFDPAVDLELLTPETGLGPIHAYIMHFRRGNKAVINEELGGLQINDAETYRNAINNYIESLNSEGVVAIVDANQLHNYDIATDDDGEPRVFTTPQGVTYAWLESPGIKEVVFVASSEPSLGFTGNEQTTWVDYGGTYTYYITPAGQLVLHSNEGGYHVAYFDDQAETAIPARLLTNIRLPGTAVDEAWNRIISSSNLLQGRWPSSSERIRQLYMDLFGKSEAEMARLNGPEYKKAERSLWTVVITQIRP